MVTHMKAQARLTLSMIWIGAALCAGAMRSAALPAAEPPSPWATVARGIWWVPEVVKPDREPDGNTVIFGAPSGLVVMDTGRHAWHRNGILALASAQHKPIVAIINSHWHLDHTSGNPALREQYPSLRVYASGAINEALSGFLAGSAARSEKYLNDPQIPDGIKEDIRAGLLTIKNGSSLRPDVEIKSSSLMSIGGRKLRINLEPYAATAGDVWVFDEPSGVAALGDLVTIPSPYLDTACPQGWSRALAKVTDTPFKIAVPGHGPLLSRTQVSQYRGAFDAFIDCAKSPKPKAVCADSWSGAMRTLLGDKPLDAASASEEAAEYVDMLRTNDGNSRFCRQPGAA
jgi:glyoxylase-like metal-dependent hydrolase (beta-lactamase superfamily II)